MNVGVTGATGLVGWHVTCGLAVRPDCVVMPADRHVFESEPSLDRFVDNCDVIVHAAGVNRADPATLQAENLRMAERLVLAMERRRVTPHVVFTNSTQHAFDNPYGQSKRDVSALLSGWATRHGAVYTDLILPHVFGEGGRPHHNSVVATFCYQLAHGESPVVINDSMLDLLHAQDVADVVDEAIAMPSGGERAVTGRQMYVTELLEQLIALHSSYAGARLPDLSDRFQVCLFNTLRSYRYPAHYPSPLTLHTDERGYLFEAVKGLAGGQTFVSHSVPGITRGNHFHLRKVERFVIVRGKAEVALRPVFRDDVVRFKLSGRTPHFIDMPTLHTHNVTNIGDEELIMLFWSNEIFDPANPDTHPDDVFAPRYEPLTRTVKVDAAG